MPLKKSTDAHGSSRSSIWRGGRGRGKIKSLLFRRGSSRSPVSSAARCSETGKPLQDRAATMDHEPMSARAGLLSLLYEKRGVSILGFLYPENRIKKRPNLQTRRSNMLYSLVPTCSINSLQTTDIHNPRLVLPCTET